MYVPILYRIISLHMCETFWYAEKHSKKEYTDCIVCVVVVIRYMHRLNIHICSVENWVKVLFKYNFNFCLTVLLTALNLNSSSSSYEEDAIIIHIVDFLDKNRDKKNNDDVWNGFLCVGTIDAITVYDF